MAGITRIQITNGHLGPGAWRFNLAKSHAPVADALYRKIFGEIGIEIAPGADILSVAKRDAEARYDWADGIDLILQSVDGMRMTVQEKFLTFTGRPTATFEERKTSGKPGGFFYCTAQYYFVGYTRLYLGRDYKPLDNPVIDFQDWILLNFPAIRQCNNLPWQERVNKYDNRRSSFRYIPFDKIPKNVIVARKVI